jgi:PIN domain nuclease of toxin-antitoxin system
VRILLDTHAWLWLVIDPERMRPDSRALASDPTNDILLSAASAWEIAIKYANGRLTLSEPPRSFVPSRMARTGAIGLSIEHAHALATATLPRHHADPFDRLLIAQAQVESLPILTADPVFGDYDVAVLRA